MIALTGFPAPLVAIGASQGESNPKESGDAQPALAVAVAKNVTAALSSEELNEMSEARKERQAESSQKNDLAGPGSDEPGQTVSIRV